ncbi:ABC transporter substrate-binding protein [Cellulomonas sp. McL0617]|uniref:ABC transporter substrate-binding protein n=1 Tax=Cellulomonas sp. McL0617 TaxID=3415675 RepID=UPI003CEBBE41
MSRIRRRQILAATAAASLIALTAACSSGSGSADASSADSGAPSGDITVLTNRTDLVDTTFADYKKTFEAKYPDVKVTFEAITDYDGEVKTRMNTDDYGDVLILPTGVANADLSSFFEPLGTTDQLGTKYRFVNEQANGGKVYALATFGNANGIVYNKKVFRDAGITAEPTSTDEFMTDLKAIKAKTDAVPLYTNYKDGWPLTWPQGLMGAYTGDKDALVKMAKDDAPWTKGQEKYEVDSLLYDVAAAGLIEADPTTTNWEDSKNLLATGKIGTMVLGSWAVPQMQDAAKTAGTDPADIGFMPAPVEVDGKLHSPVGGDRQLAINIHSKHKAAARAWFNWFIDDSGFYQVAGGLPTVKDAPPSDNLKDFEATGVQYLEMTPSPELSDRSKASEVGIDQPDYYRELIDAARGASGQNKDQIFQQLDSKWASAS